MDIIIELILVLENFEIKTEISTTGIIAKKAIKITSITSRIEKAMLLLTKLWLV
ncbi:MAG: hypothetical protein AAE984_01345 [Cuniculiplasma divulgatum]|jgi:hypothetical protein